MSIKDVSYVKFNSVNPLYLINKINGYIEERNGNKHLTSAPTDESKQTLKNIKNYGEKILDLVRSLTNNWDNYNDIYMKSSLIWVMVFL